VEPQTSPILPFIAKWFGNSWRPRWSMSRFDDERSLALASAAAIPGWESRVLNAEPAISDPGFAELARRRWKPRGG